jgi:hypothetical protein
MLAARLEFASPNLSKHCAKRTKRLVSYFMEYTYATSMLSTLRQSRNHGAFDLTNLAAQFHSGVLRVPLGGFAQKMLKVVGIPARSASEGRKTRNSLACASGWYDFLGKAG